MNKNRIVLVSCILMICLASAAFGASPTPATSISAGDLLADTISSGVATAGSHSLVVVPMPEPFAGSLLLVDFTAVGALVLWIKRRKQNA